ncbi:uncharacterized protein LOC121605999 [Chelmon rostratus]|uniref:uncharacterized protein LOC121605999 n=1 Tax=Chelmon rostratus TaxID=109905 RepID=UPI001BE72350|nr:uncharacterized protein LOC121605999 [Chelmon rostratus]
MDLILFLSLSLCWCMAAARSLWTDKPWIIVSSAEIEDGETVEVTCTLPIDYRGGDCRLFRDNSPVPFRLKTATGYLCVFYLTSQELLGRQPVGSQIFLKCDYHIQQYTSVSSDVKGVTVWGSSPSPGLSVSRRFVSPDDSVEVTCSPPLNFVHSCHFYRDEIHIADGSCRRNLTGKQLSIWEKSTILLPVNMTCTYHPYEHRYVRSEPSNHNLLFVVDASRASSSVDCKVSVEDDQLAAFGRSSWTNVGADGPTVTVQVTNSVLMPNETCSNIQ